MSAQQRLQSWGAWVDERHSILSRHLQRHAAASSSIHDPSVMLGWRCCTVQRRALGRHRGATGILPRHLHSTPFSRLQPATRLSAPSAAPPSSLHPAPLLHPSPPAAVSRLQSAKEDVAAALRLRGLRRRRRAEAERIVLLPSSDDERDIDVSVGRAAAVSSPSAPTSPSAPPAAARVAPPSRLQDPDEGYLTDEDSTRASLLAFAEFDARNRAQRSLTLALPPAAATASPPSTPSTLSSSPSSSARPSSSSPQVDLTISASLDAFAELERSLALKRLNAKRWYLEEEATTPSTSAAVMLTPPRMPEPGECCGMGCANCPWIVYGEQMAAFEEQQKQQRQ